MNYSIAISGSGLSALITANSWDVFIKQYVEFFAIYEKTLPGFDINKVNWAPAGENDRAANLYVGDFTVGINLKVKTYPFNLKGQVIGLSFFNSTTRRFIVGTYVDKDCLEYLTEDGFQYWLHSTKQKINNPR